MNVFMRVMDSTWARKSPGHGSIYLEEGEGKRAKKSIHNKKLCIVPFISNYMCIGMHKVCMKMYHRM